MYAKLVLRSKTRMTDQYYTYRIPSELLEEIEIGMRVLVPFGRGNKTTVGLVVEINSDLDEDYKVKDIIKPIEDSPILNQELIDIAKFMCEEYLSDLSSSFQTVLPPGDIVKINEVFYSNTENDTDEFLRFLSDPRGFEEVKNEFPNMTRTQINDLVENGAISRKYEFTKDANIKYIKIVKLIDSDFRNINPRAHKQFEILNYLSSKNSCELPEVLKATNSSLSSLRALESKKLISITEKRVFREVLDEEIKIYSSHVLNEDQSRVFDEIMDGSETTYLLKGVTGSGKTEVYLHLAEAIMAKGQQVMILVPEISLTPQTIARFAGRFGKKVAVLHSRLSISERFDQWRMIKEGMVQIVVGTRSAVFAPFQHLGMIIIDEEHELSYISEKNPKYDAIDIARFRAHYNNCNVVLGTATPRIESYYNSVIGEYKLLELSSRANKNELPEVIAVDMRDELKKGNITMFSDALREEMELALADKKQIILFLNKRGHTSYVFCRNCGYNQRCDDCDVSMTYHKSKGISICHFCGKTANKPLICPSCGSNAIKEFGAGTQKLEEYTKEVFPNAKVARMDMDTMSKKGSYGRIYKQMANGEIDILIGTQMLSKGFDFKNVTVVGIVAADLTLNLPDYRSQEKTFQLLTQVAGRAGRGDDKGKVIIQTYQPKHYAIFNAMDHDYDEFYNDEIKMRREYKYPPFQNLVLIRVIHQDRLKASKRSFEIIKIIRENLRTKDYEIIGPNPAVIERIRNMYRFNIVIKTKNDLNMVKRVLDECIIRNKNLIGDGYKIFFMINPISLF